MERPAFVWPHKLIICLGIVVLFCFYVLAPTDCETCEVIDSYYSGDLYDRDGDRIVLLGNVIKCSGPAFKSSSSSTCAWANRTLTCQVIPVSAPPQYCSNYAGIYVRRENVFWGTVILFWWLVAFFALIGVLITICIRVAT